VEKTPEIIKETQQGEQTGEAPPYRVIIHNDDVTPMDFVVGVLLQIFLLAGPQALQVMYTAHNHGSAYVQTLPKPEALLRVHRAELAARLEGFPLTFTVERE
jgi:ATP-dependent Clp protease adaptor protein ClpS